MSFKSNNKETLGFHPRPYQGDDLPNQVASAIGVQRMKSFGAGYRDRGGPCLVVLYNMDVKKIK